MSTVSYRHVGPWWVVVYLLEFGGGWAAESARQGAEDLLTGAENRVYALTVHAPGWPELDRRSNVEAPSMARAQAGCERRAVGAYSSSVSPWYRRRAVRSRSRVRVFVKNPQQADLVEGVHIEFHEEILILPHLMCFKS
jgi:hypothetical protein